MRIRISHSRFPKLGGLKKGDLVSKLWKGLALKDFIKRYYTCNSTKKVSGKYLYKGEFHKICVVYKVTCKGCGNLYVVNTQNKLKMEWSNFEDVAQKLMHDNNPDPFAARLA